MKTVVLRIRPLGDGGADGYPLDLFVGDGAALTEQRAVDALAPTASGVIPADLGVAAPPLHPLTEQPLDARQAKHYLHENGAGTPLLERVGTLLFDVLNRPNVAVAWQQARDEAWANRGREPVLRTLLDVRAPDLRVLPWELLRAGKNALFRGRWWPAARWDARGVGPSPDVAWPLRVLIVVGCGPNDLKLSWQQEFYAVFETMSVPKAEPGAPVIDLVRHKIDLDFFECRTHRSETVKEALKARIELFAPHVLHFIGHGRPGLGGRKAALELWDAAAAAPVDLTAQELHDWLAPMPPRITILNACRTANLLELEGAWAVSDALGDAGVAAVVGMQGDVDGDAAARFSAGFYGELAKGRTIDLALVEARARMATGREEERDWALPTLVLGVPPEHVLPMAPDGPELLVLRRKVAVHQRLTTLATFVDRRTERRALHAGVAGHAAGGPPGGLLLVVGNRDMGKTWLVGRFVEGCLLRLLFVTYVDFKGSPKLDAIGLLRAIRGGEPKTEPEDLLRPRLYKQFGEFNDTLNELLAGNMPAQAPGDGRDRGLPFQPGVSHAETMPTAFDAFLRCLQRAAAERPAVVVLDHVAEALDPDVFGRDVRPYLVDRVAAGGVRNVHLVLTATEAEMEQFGLDALAAVSPGCRLNGFDSSEWGVIAREFVVCKGLDRKKAETVIANISARMRADMRLQRDHLYALPAMIDLQGEG